MGLNMKKEQIKYYNDTAGIVLVGIALVCAFLLCCKVLTGRFIQAGDSFWHYANEIHMLRSISAGRGMFDCFARGMGLPLASFYQPLLYIIVVIAKLWCPFFSIFTWHNIIVCLLFTIYPLSVYFMVRSFRFDRLTAGLASLLALLPVSGWGHTLDAYFWVGLHTQLIGAVGFPLALGAMHRLTWSKQQRRYMIMLMASLAGVVAGHAVFAVLLLYTLVVYVLLFLVWRGRKTCLLMMRKWIVCGLMAVMLIAFWLIPFIQFNAQYKFIPESQRSFSPLAVSLTIKQSVETFLYGELLDTNHAESPLFGGGEEGFRWSMNQSFARWRLFTILTIIGGIILMLRARRFREFLWLISFMWGCVLFVGSDDLPWLRFLPFAKNFQPIRAIFLIELAAAVLSAIALRSTVRLLIRITPLRIRPAAYIVSTLLIMLISVPLYERFRIADMLVFSGCTQDQAELMDQYTSLPGRSAFDRTYFGRYSGISKLSLRAMSDCCFLTNMVGHDNDMAGSVSWLINDRQSSLLQSDDLAHLLSLRYITGRVGWLEDHEKISDQPVVPMQVLRSGTRYDVYERSGAHTMPLVSCWKKPVMVYCTNTQWYNLNQLWINEFIKYGYEVAPMVKAPSEFVHWLEPSLFSAVVLIDFPRTRHNKRFLYNDLKSFVIDGGKLLSNKPVWDIPIKPLTASHQNILIDTLRQSPKLDDLKLNVQNSSWHSVRATCSFDAPRIIYAPTAFYHTWNASDAKKPLETFWMTPGVVAIALSKSSDQVSLEYVSLRAHWILLLIGWIGVLGVVWIIKKHDLGLFVVPHATTYHCVALKQCFQWLRLLVMIVIIWAGLMYSRQAMDKQAVTVYPSLGQTEVNPYAAVFRWNAVPDALGYHFQISKSKRSFDEPVFDVQNVVDTTIGYRSLKPFTRYYWRVKSESGRWSPVRSFKTGGYYPVVTE